MGQRREQRLVDWVVATNSNVHVTKNLNFFTRYTPFATRFSGGSGPEVEVEGIGDVTLAVATDARNTGPSASGTMILRDVLYAPEAVCNIYGVPVSDYVSLEFDGQGTPKLTDSRTGDTVAIIDRPHLYRLRLQGQAPNATSLDRNQIYMINAHWPDAERNRWLEYKESTRPAAPATTVPSGQGGNPPYTAAEKDWLKTHYDGEYHFLQSHGLSIFDEEKRAEGRTIARALMQNDDD